jgi:hypothetical protein
MFPCLWRSSIKILILLLSCIKKPVKCGSLDRAMYETLKTLQRKIDIQFNVFSSVGLQIVNINVFMESSFRKETCPLLSLRVVDLTSGGWETDFTCRLSSWGFQRRSRPYLWPVRYKASVSYNPPGTGLPLDPRVLFNIFQPPLPSPHHRWWAATSGTQEKCLITVLESSNITSER